MQGNRLLEKAVTGLDVFAQREVRPVPSFVSMETQPVPCNAVEGTIGFERLLLAPSFLSCAIYIQGATSVDSGAESDLDRSSLHSYLCSAAFAGLVTRAWW